MAQVERTADRRRLILTQRTCLEGTPEELREAFVEGFGEDNAPSLEDLRQDGYSDWVFDGFEYEPESAIQAVDATIHRLLETVRDGDSGSGPYFLEQEVDKQVLTELLYDEDGANQPTNPLAGEWSEGVDGIRFTLTFDDGSVTVTFSAYDPRQAIEAAHRHEQASAAA